MTTTTAMARRYLEEEQPQQQQCVIQPFDEDGFVVKSSFRNTASILFAHFEIPRFGHSSEIMAVVTGTSDDVQDYIRGLTASSVAVLVVATTWMIGLIVCKYALGRRRVGWLSGQFRKLPPRPSSSALSSSTTDADKKENVTTTTTKAMEQHPSSTLSASVSSPSGTPLLNSVTNRSKGDDDDEVDDIKKNRQNDYDDKIEKNGDEQTAKKDSDRRSTSVHFFTVHENIHGNYDEENNIVVLSNTITKDDEDDKDNDNVHTKQTEAIKKPTNSINNTNDITNDGAEEPASFFETFFGNWKLFWNEEDDKKKKNERQSDSTTDRNSLNKNSTQRQMSLSTSQKVRLIHDLDMAFHIDDDDDQYGNDVNLPPPITSVCPLDDSHSNNKNTDVANNTTTTNSKKLVENDNDNMTATAADGTIIQQSQQKEELSSSVLSSEYRVNDVTMLTRSSLRVGHNDDVGCGEDGDTNNKGDCMPSDEQQQSQKHQQSLDRDVNDDVEKEEEEEGDDDDEWLRHYNKIIRMHRCFRVICWLCSLGIVVGSILMIVNGVDYLKATMQNGITSLELAQGIALEAADFTQSLLDGIERVQSDTIALLLSLNGICPSIRERVCALTLDRIPDDRCNVNDSNVTLLTLFNDRKQEDDSGDGLGGFDIETALSDVTDAAIGTGCAGLDVTRTFVCNTTGIFTNFAAERLSERFNQTGWLQSEILTLHEDIVSAYDRMENAQSTVRTFDSSLSWALLFMVLSAAIGVVMLYMLTFKSSVCIARCLQRRWIFALLALSMGLSLILTCVFILGTIAVADFCVDGPDQRLLELAAHYGSDTQSSLFPRKTTYEFIQFYLNKCSSPPASLNALNNFVTESDTIVFGLESELEELSTRITELCGTDESGALFLAVVSRTVRDYTCGLTNRVRAFRELVRCSNIYPLYDQIVYQTVCFAGSSAIWWIAATNFFTVFAALILLTFRSAFFDIEIEHDIDEEEDASNDPSSQSVSNHSDLHDTDDSKVAFA